MERHGCVKYRKKKNNCMDVCLEGLYAGNRIHSRKYIEDVYNLDISEGMKAKIRQTKNIGKSKPSKPCIF